MMRQQIALSLGILYFFLGAISGLDTIILEKSRISKSGGAFIGGVSAIVSGLVFVLIITDIESRLRNSFSLGVSMNELLPSMIASILGGIFVTYVMSLVLDGKNKWN